MKKAICILGLFCLVFVFVSCEKGDTVSQRTPVTVNTGESGDVNGYRLPDSQYSDKNTVSAKDVTPEKKSNPNTQAEAKKPGVKSNGNGHTQYCANVKSKVFHLPTCESVGNMKDDNKLFLSDREALIEDGYTPCKRCNP